MAYGRGERNARYPRPGGVQPLVALVYEGPVTMIIMENEMVDWISYGGVKDLEDLYGTGA